MAERPEKAGRRTFCRFFSLLSALTALSALSALSAQTITAAGRVLTADSTPVRGSRVVLHRVGRQMQGPIDSTLSSVTGRFRFSFRPDTTAFYLISTQFAGIEYFSKPVSTNPSRPDGALTLLVYDTSSTAPVVLEARHLVVTRPGSDGSRNVLDLMVVQNTGRLTRISSDTSRPTWSAPLLSGTLGLELGESDLSPDAVARRGDSVVVIAPLAPGEKQLTVQYLIPAGRKTVQLPVTAAGVTLNVLAEETAIEVTGAGIALADSQVIQGRSFRRWTGVSRAGSVLRLVLPSPGESPKLVLLALVGILGLIFAAAAWRLLLPTKRVSTRSPDELLDAIAALDARYVGRKEETSADEWKVYLDQRAGLKARLEASLAAGSWDR
jgi:hypothetical protein